MVDVIPKKNILFLTMRPPDHSSLSMATDQISPTQMHRVVFIKIFKYEGYHTGINSNADEVLGWSGPGLPAVCWTCFLIFAQNV